VIFTVATACRGGSVNVCSLRTTPIWSVDHHADPLPRMIYTAFQRVNRCVTRLGPETRGQMTSSERLKTRCYLLSQIRRAGSRVPFCLLNLATALEGNCSLVVGSPSPSGFVVHSLFVRPVVQALTLTTGWSPTRHPDHRAAPEWTCGPPRLRGRSVPRYAPLTRDSPLSPNPPHVARQQERLHGN
jgi:hypothetical protein